MNSNTTARLKGIETRQALLVVLIDQQQHNCPLKGH